MGFRDLITLVFSNLNRMRGRVIMTAMGVVIGTAAIVILISLASGLQANTVENFESFGSLNQINVFSGGRFGGDSEAEGLTPSVLEELGQIEGVVAVTPQEQFSGGSLLKFNRYQGFASIGFSVRLNRGIGQFYCNQTATLQKRRACYRESL